jgi:lipopolysaccharide transport system ATP-binding protein
MHEPAISVQKVTCRFEPVRVRRIESLFAVLGGIVPGEFSQDLEDDLEEDEEPREPAARSTFVLTDVSFEAAGPGACVAVVGPALSGKSLLMRVLAGLTPPTSGQVVIHGRVAPALLGTLRLFPRYGRVKRTLPSLAALLGIHPRVARSRFPEIADFAGGEEIGKRHVSLVSKPERWGLTLGLALHADADIVLVDPVPSDGRLGDMCRERLLELKRAGALIVLTSRTVESISWIADRVIHLDNGSVVADTPITPSPKPQGVVSSTNLLPS